MYKNLALNRLLISLHGATVSVRFPDADSEIAQRVRQMSAATRQLLRHWICIPISHQTWRPTLLQKWFTAAIRILTSRNTGSKWQA